MYHFYFFDCIHVKPVAWRCNGLMVSALDSRASGLGSSPGQGHNVVYLKDTLLSQCLSSPRCIHRHR